MKAKREYKLTRAQEVAKAKAQLEAIAKESLEKKREAKIKEVREVKREAIELASAERERATRIKLAKKAAKEANLNKLKLLKKELEIIEADRPEKSLVDMTLDDKPIGRLILNHNKAYEFNLETPKEAPNKAKLLVDLKIDGLKGPIPKVYHPKSKMGRVFVDEDSKIEQFKMPVEEMEKITDLSKIKLSDAKKELAQISQQSESPSSVANKV